MALSPGDQPHAMPQACRQWEELQWQSRRLASSMLLMGIPPTPLPCMPVPGCEPRTVHDLAQRQGAGTVGTGVPDAAGPAGRVPEQHPALVEELQRHAAPRLQPGAELGREPEVLQVGWEARVCAQLPGGFCRGCLLLLLLFLWSAGCW